MKQRKDKPLATEPDILADEESIGVNGRGSLYCVVKCDGPKSSYSKKSAVELRPGSVIRVSIGVAGKHPNKPKKTARMICFVDPFTGKLVTRMGVYDISKSRSGREDSMQIVETSDLPVVSIDETKD